MLMLDVEPVNTENSTRQIIVFVLLMFQLKAICLCRSCFHVAYVCAYALVKTSLIKARHTLMAILFHLFKVLAVNILRW